MSILLDEIEGPSDLKKLAPSQLSTLAEELRKEMIATVQKTGGHLASSLGTVELTIALHRVFDAPKDKIIWDVGHQAYAHKLLTGRRRQFASQRQHGGISGFPSRDESIYDPFGVGHASTSISAAMGIGVARDMNSEEFDVIAVIGDGSIGGGMALEALNNVGASSTKTIIVLNDNGMSISPTVGAISTILRKIRFNRLYNNANESSKRILHKIPLGKQIQNLVSRTKHSMKGFFIPNTLWEEFGLAYMGPINGHNIRELESALKEARAYKHRSVLVHVVTTKGKGYSPAEDDAICFHGISPSDAKPKVAPSYSQVFASTALEIMRRDASVVIITAAMPEGNCLAAIQQEFPKRVIDVGICEQHAVTFAAGMATQGIKPIVAIYSTFLQRSFDQIIHDVCLQRLPVTFAVDRGGIVGDDGKTHQGAFDLSYLSLIPEMTVASPKDENELQHLLFTAVNSGKPMAVRYARGSGQGVAMDDTLREIPIGTAEVIRNGSHITLVAIGLCVQTAMQAANILSAEGIEATVVNARFASPIDHQLILSEVCKTGRLVTIEENTLNGGFGSAIIATLSNSATKGFSSIRIGIPNKFIEHGTQAILRAKYSLDAEGIVKQMKGAFPDLATK